MIDGASRRLGALIERRLSDVPPLPRGPGAPPPAIPAALKSLLFADGQTTVAVIDAALVFGLVERLQAEGLPHACLFEGEEAEQLADVAPWLVEVSPDTPLLLDLLSAGGPPQGLAAGRVAGFVRSRAGLQAVRGQLRRLHRLPNGPDRRPVYLRIWSPRALRVLRPWLALRPDQVAAVFGRAIDALIWPDRLGNGWTAITPAEAGPPDARFRVDRPLARRLAITGRVARAQRLGSAAEAILRDEDPALIPAIEAMPPRQRLRYCTRLDAMGIEEPPVAAELLSIRLMTGLDVTREPAFHYATRNPFLMPNAKARQLTMAFRMIAAMQQEG